MPQFVSTGRVPLEEYRHCPNSEKFMSYGRIVDENGNPATAEYCGKRYQLIAKKECGEKSVLRFGQPLPRLESIAWDEVTCIEELERGMREDRRIDPILPEEPVDIGSSEITRLIESGNEYVYTVKANPQFVITEGVDCDFPVMYRRRAILKVMEVCKRLQLNQLVIPHSVIKTVGGRDLLVAERLPVKYSVAAQEELFEAYEDSLTEAVRQLAVLIRETGLSNIHRFSVAVLEGSKDSLGMRKLALLDIYYVYPRPAEGFLGTQSTPGLIGMISLKQARMVRKIAGDTITDEQFRLKFEQRETELEKRAELKAYHKENQIYTGKEPLFVDITKLTLDPPLLPLATAVIDQINHILARGKDDIPAIGTRRVRINPEDKYFKRFFSPELQSQIRKVADALLAHGAIFAILRENHRGILIQA
ncbi:MAG: hypothetical protein S4CHLAM102_08290 [Chlamydiia bacterium]|nr:hypothetical protein [Chlamydiia bacterium]